MKPITIFRHAPHEGPGYFAEFLEQRRIPYKIIRIDQGDPVPERLDATSALVFMGGPMSVNDTLPWIEKELALIRLAVANAMPVLGHCLGGQLISKALGARVTKNPVKEIGWGPVRRIENAAARDWLGDLPAEIEVFHWHGETFSLPSGATLILSSAYCPNQAFVLGNILALQCHVEMTAAMVQTWCEEEPETVRHPAPSVQSASEMLRNLRARADALQGVARVLYSRWLTPLLQPHTDAKYAGQKLEKR